MKKTIAFILIFTLLFTSIVSAEIYYSDTFKHWSRNDVNYVTNNLQLLRGYDDMTFRPDNDITRGEFITILTRLGYKLKLIEEIYSYSINYSDMSNKEWSYTYIISFYNYMNENFSEYTFHNVFPGIELEPDKPITREEAIALIGVLCPNSIYDNELYFKDVNASYKFYNQVKILCNSGILEGYKDNTLRLHKNITRGEAAAIIRRVFDNAKSFSANYLSKLSYMPISGEDVFSFFGHYNLNTQNDMEKKYIKAKYTLDYLAFNDYIFDEDKHLYDTNPISTLLALRKAGFPNKVGVNFYLLRYGKLSNIDNVTLAHEMLKEMLTRDDLTDAELMQIFTLLSNINVTEASYMVALKKWYSSTSSMNALLNIKTFRYAHYISVGNKTYVSKMIYDDLICGTDFTKILTINWYTDVNKYVNMLNFDSIDMYYTPYLNSTFSVNQNNPNNKNMSVLKNITLVENDNYIDISMIKNDDLYYKYSLNKAFLFNYLKEYERGFAEAINDYKIITKLNIYKSGKNAINDRYNGILKAFKGKL